MSIYNKVAFNKKLAIMKENLCTKYFSFTYKYIALNKKPPITKANLHIFFLLYVQLSVLLMVFKHKHKLLTYTMNPSDR